jgi:integrase
VNCLYCDTPIPDGSRRDRKYCNRRCSALASYYRRKAGLPIPPRWQHPAMSSNDPVVQAAAARTQQLAEAHGWDRSSARCVLDGIVTVLDGRPAGERVPMSEVRARTHRHVPKPRLAEVLADLDIFDDDTTPAIRAWIDRVTGEVATGFAETIQHWLVVLLDGDARARPRSQATLYAYFGSVRPFLDQWATRYSHLREVTKNDIYAVLDPLRGYQRNNAIHALRSLFGFAKKRGLVFANPTIGVKAHQIDPEMVPMSEDEIRLIEQLAVAPAQRLAVALAAEHAARTGTIRNLTLEHLDMPNRRITLDGHNQRLGELTYRALTAWLDHRRAMWPLTPNRHVLVNTKTVLGAGPVSGPFVRFSLGRNGFSIDRIRADRILHEALTAGPDPLHLALVFNIEHSTALRYATVAEHLLSDELERRNGSDAQTARLGPA